MYSYIAKSLFDDHLGSSNEPCYIQNRVITNRVIKRLMCTHDKIVPQVKFTCTNPLLRENMQIMRGGRDRALS